MGLTSSRKKKVTTTASSSTHMLASAGGAYGYVLKNQLSNLPGYLPARSASWPPRIGLMRIAKLVDMVKPTNALDKNLLR